MTPAGAATIAEGIAEARRLAADGRTEEAVRRLDRLRREAPDDDALLLAIAAVSRSAGLLDEAETAYRAILQRRPSVVEAAVGLADVLVARGDTEPAIQILSRIRGLAPGLLPASLSLGAALLAAGRAEAALALYDEILGGQDGLSQVHANRAEALARLGRHREALAAVETARRLRPDDPRIILNHAFALLTEGRIEEGLEAYEARLDPALAVAPSRLALDLPRWEAGPRPEGRLLIAAEQGLGDEIRFGALAWRLACDGAPLIVEAEPRLLALLRRSLPGAAVVAYDRRRSGVKPVFHYDWLSRLSPPPSAWIDLASLPLRLGLPSSGPVAPAGYLRPEEERVAAFRAWLAPLRHDAPVVGIVWGSSRADAARSRFYPPLEAWQPILDLPGIRFVDLQYTESAADRAVFRERLGADIRAVEHLDKRNDIDGAAALAASLDAVVGVSSSVTAMAGAVGTPTIEVVADRIWLPRAGGRDALLGAIRFADSDLPGDWEQAMRRAATALTGLVATGRRRF